MDGVLKVYGLVSVAWVNINTSPRMAFADSGSMLAQLARSINNRLEEIGLDAVAFPYLGAYPSNGTSLAGISKTKVGEILIAFVNALDRARWVDYGDGMTFQAKWGYCGDDWEFEAYPNEQAYLFIHNAENWRQDIYQSPNNWHTIINNLRVLLDSLEKIRSDVHDQTVLAATNGFYGRGYMTFNCDAGQLWSWPNYGPKTICVGGYVPENPYPVTYPVPVGGELGYDMNYYDQIYNQHPYFAGMRFDKEWRFPTLGQPNFYQRWNYIQRACLGVRWQHPFYRAGRTLNWVFASFQHFWNEWGYQGTLDDWSFKVQQIDQEEFDSITRYSTSEGAVILEHTSEDDVMPNLPFSMTDWISIQGDLTETPQAYCVLMNMRPVAIKRPLDAKTAVDCWHLPNDYPEFWDKNYFFFYWRPDYNDNLVQTYISEIQDGPPP